MIRIPPGGKVTMEIDIEDGSAHVVSPRDGGFRDPEGGPPLFVSRHLLPDPLAIYFAATTAIEATRALDAHTAAIERHAATTKEHIAALDRADRSQKISLFVAIGLSFFSAVQLLFAFHVLQW